MASLITIEATIDADGTVRLSEPVEGPASAVLTVLVDEPSPNAVTRAAMAEDVASLPRFASVEALLEDLEN